MAAYDDIDQLFDLLDTQDPAPGPAFRATLDMLQSGQISLVATKPASRSRRFRLVGMAGPAVAAALVVAFMTVAVFGTGNSSNRALPQQELTTAPVVATVEDQGTNSASINLPSEANPQIASPVGRSNVVSSTRSRSGDLQLQRFLQLEQLANGVNSTTATKVNIELSTADSVQSNRPPPSRAY